MTPRISSAGAVGVRRLVLGGWTHEGFGHGLYRRNVGESYPAGAASHHRAHGHDAGGRQPQDGADGIEQDEAGQSQAGKGRQDQPETGFLGDLEDRRPNHRRHHAAGAHQLDHRQRQFRGRQQNDQQDQARGQRHHGQQHGQEGLAPPHLLRRHAGGALDPHLGQLGGEQERHDGRHRQRRDDEARPPAVSARHAATTVPSVARRTASGRRHECHGQGQRHRGREATQHQTQVAPQRGGDGAARAVSSMRRSSAAGSGRRVDAPAAERDDAAPPAPGRDGGSARDSDAGRAPGGLTISRGSQPDVTQPGTRFGDAEAARQHRLHQPGADSQSGASSGRRTGIDAAATTAPPAEGEQAAAGQPAEAGQGVGRPPGRGRPGQAVASSSSPAHVPDGQLQPDYCSDADPATPRQPAAGPPAPTARHSSRPPPWRQSAGRFRDRQRVEQVLAGTGAEGLAQAAGPQGQRQQQERKRPADEARTSSGPRAVPELCRPASAARRAASRSRDRSWRYCSVVHSTHAHQDRPEAEEDEGMLRDPPAHQGPPDPHDAQHGAREARSSVRGACALSRGNHARDDWAGGRTAPGARADPRRSSGDRDSSPSGPVTPRPSPRRDARRASPTSGG